MDLTKSISLISTYNTYRLEGYVGIEFGGIHNLIGKKRVEYTKSNTNLTVQSVEYQEMR